MKRRGKRRMKIERGKKIKKREERERRRERRWGRRTDENKQM